MGLIYPLYNIINYTPWAQHLMEDGYACAMCLYIILVSGGTSLGNVLAIAVDRYLAVLKPLHYKQWMKPKRVRVILAVIWLYVPFISASLFLIYGKNTEELDILPCSLLNAMPSWFFFSLLLPHLLIPAVISKVLYIRIMYVAWKQESKIFAERMAYSTGVSKREAKAAKMMAKIVTLFTVCWSPYLICHVAIYILAFDTPFWLYELLEFSKILMLANSCMSPIIYYWKNNDFRRAMGLCTQCTQDEKYLSNSTSANRGSVANHSMEAWSQEMSQ